MNCYVTLKNFLGKNIHCAHAINIATIVRIVRIFQKEISAKGEVRNHRGRPWAEERAAKGSHLWWSVSGWREVGEGKEPCVCRNVMQLSSFWWWTALHPSPGTTSISASHQATPGTKGLEGFQGSLLSHWGDKPEHRMLGNTQGKRHMLVTPEFYRVKEHLEKVTGRKVGRWCGGSEDQGRHCQWEKGCSLGHRSTRGADWTQNWWDSVQESAEPRS